MINDILHIIHTEINGRDIERMATQRRKQNLLDQCAHQQIKFKIISGITSGKIRFHNINAAHKSAVKIAKDNGYSNIIIAEDDIQFTAPGAWNYFLSQIPEMYDIFCGVIYAGTVEDGQILSPFSGGMTLYSVSSRFYDAILNMPPDVHIDRWIGGLYDQCELYTVRPYVCKQMGGHSFNLDRPMTYGVYEEDKIFFTG